MPNKLPIITYPNKILRKSTFTVTKVDSDLQKFIKDLLYTMYYAKGAGLSAIQVNRMERIFTIDEHYTSQNDPLVIINPEILEFSDEKISFKEGCLSFPDKFENIFRAKTVKVKYIDPSEKEITTEFTGFAARIFLHEFDHLENKLMVDYLPSFKKKKYSKE